MDLTTLTHFVDRALMCGAGAFVIAAAAVLLSLSRRPRLCAEEGEGDVPASTVKRTMIAIGALGLGAIGILLIWHGATAPADELRIKGPGPAPGPSFGFSLIG